MYAGCIMEVTQPLLGCTGVKETRAVGCIIAESFKFSLVNSLRDSRFKFSEKSSHPILSRMMISLAEEDIFLSVQPAWNKGYKGDE